MSSAMTGLYTNRILALIQKPRSSVRAKPGMQAPRGVSKDQPSWFETRCFATLRGHERN